MKWLLLLLVVYLVVIGPLDQILLKKLNRQMLTWVTFPGYVVLFSLLIYYIGYRLRAGETEWNELHVVDVVPRAEGVDFRGRTYASLYSPVNARYALSSDLPLSTLRGEFLGAMGGRESARMEVLQRDSGFDAEVFVPVWTSQLLVWEWSRMGEAPMDVSLVPQSNGVEVKVVNRLAVPLADVRVIWKERVHDLGDCPANQSKTMLIDPREGTRLQEVLGRRTGTFAQRAQMRQRAFGSSVEQWVDLTPENLLAVSCLGLASGDRPVNQRQFLYPAGAEVTSWLSDDQACVLAWVKNFSPVSSLRQFAALRSAQNSLLRLAVSPGTDQAP